MKRILVHVCCGPCAVYPIKKLLAGRFGVYGFFYNPNIHPEEEFKKRLEASKKLASLMGIETLFHDQYDPLPFLSGLAVLGKAEPLKDERCETCYAIRLKKTAETAKECGFDYFSSSLLFSKRQFHDIVVSVGKKIEKEVGVSFYYEDFRSGWQEGIEESKKMGLYRQNYCGCVFSRIERGL